MIIMASHGQTGLNHMMGRVAERVMHHASVPVLLVRDGTLPRPPTLTDCARRPATAQSATYPVHNVDGQG